MYIEGTRDIKFYSNKAHILLRANIINRSMLPRLGEDVIVKDVTYAMACRINNYTAIEIYDFDKWVEIKVGDTKAINSIYTKCKEEIRSCGYSETQIVVDELPKVEEAPIVVEDPVTEEVPQEEEVVEPEVVIDEVIEEPAIEEEEAPQEEVVEAVADEVIEEPVVEETEAPVEEQEVEVEEDEEEFEEVEEDPIDNGTIKEIAPSSAPRSIPVNKKKKHH